MKPTYLIPAIFFLAACSAQENSAPVADATSTADEAPAGPYSADNLAYSEACVDLENRMTLLEPGQTLLERGPAGLVTVVYNNDGEVGSHDFAIIELAEDLRARVDGAAADFYRNAGVAYDVTTDHVIYHRRQDGTFCTVVNLPEITAPLIAEAQAVQAELDSRATDSADAATDPEAGNDAGDQ